MTANHEMDFGTLVNTRGKQSPKWHLIKSVRDFSVFDFAGKCDRSQYIGHRSCRVKDTVIAWS